MLGRGRNGLVMLSSKAVGSVPTRLNGQQVDLDPHARELVFDVDHAETDLARESYEPRDFVAQGEHSLAQCLDATDHTHRSLRGNR